jgi:hypothetical protein
MRLSVRVRMCVCVDSAVGEKKDGTPGGNLKQCGEAWADSPVPLFF